MPRPVCSIAASPRLGPRYRCRCCGPKADGTGAGKELAAAILYILAGIVHFVGAVLGLLWYFALAEDVKKLTTWHSIAKKKMSTRYPFSNLSKIRNHI